MNLTKNKSRWSWNVIIIDRFIYLYLGIRCNCWIVSLRLQFFIAINCGNFWFQECSRFRRDQSEGLVQRRLPQLQEIISYSTTYSDGFQSFVGLFLALIRGWVFFFFRKQTFSLRPTQREEKGPSRVLFPIYYCNKTKSKWLYIAFVFKKIKNWCKYEDESCTGCYSVRHCHPFLDPNQSYIVKDNFFSNINRLHTLKMK